MKRILALCLISFVAAVAIAQQIVPRPTSASIEAALDDLVTLMKGQTARSAAKKARTTTFMVTNTGDNGGLNPAPGAGTGTLRQAIVDANANAGPDMITFAIGTGAQTINLSSALPTITGSVTIDGTTQPGFSSAPIIELNGAGAGAGTNGLTLSVGSSTIKGLIINRFGQNGILVQSNGNTIQGCYIGTDVTGAIDLGNGLSGVRLDGSQGNTVGSIVAGEGNLLSGNNEHGVLIFGSSASGNQVLGNLIGTNAAGTVDLGNTFDGILINFAPGNIIGGTTAAARNIISGNNRFGILIADPTSAGNQVLGNYIGTDVTGTLDVGNTFTGIRIDTTPNNVVGGTQAGAGNLISGNDGAGILIIASAAMGNQVRGNLIGTKADGVTALANAGDGININNASNNIIGGTATGAGNTIAFNLFYGIKLVTGGNGNQIRGNSIFSNADLGIDLDPDGVTPNDAGDGDGGVNNLQNFPVLTSVTNPAGSVTIQGTLNSTANTIFRLDFFSSEVSDPSGFGEGQTFIGSTLVTTNGAGNASFTATFSVTVPSSYGITATATDTAGNTSEFSARLQTCVATVAGLRSWWPANGTGTRDIVGPNNLINGVDGFVTFPPGKVGAAFGFNGNNSLVSLSSTGLPTGSSDRTIEMWVYINSFIAAEAFFAGYGNFGTTNESYHLGTLGSNLFISTWGPSLVGPALSTGTWYHVAATNVGNLFTLYLNGSPVGSATLAVSTPPSAFRVGRIPFFSDRRLDGLVDELSVYDRALSPSEIQAIFNAGSAGKCPCVQSISPARRSFGNRGGDGSFNVTATPECNWTAVPTAPWIVITSSNSGTGSGTVSYLVRDSEGVTNSRAINVGTLFHLVERSCCPVEACVSTISPTFALVEANGGSGSINVTASFLCTWEAESDSDWITITSDIIGTGNGTVTYSVASNNAITARSGTITVGGRTTNIKQAGCTQLWQQEKVIATDGASFDNLGSSSAISGDTLVVGADFHDTPAGQDAGSAYVFVREGTNWTEQQMLVASDGGIGHRFGGRVAISENTIVIGAIQANGVTAFTGAAYVFVRSGNVWTQQQKLVANDGVNSDFFGTSVAISGDTIVVGAIGVNTGVGDFAGAAYVFKRSGTTWTAQQKLIASDGAEFDEFGRSVGVDGDRLVVGADAGEGNEPANFLDTGSAYVFERSGATWTEQKELIADDGNINDIFGISVAISGSTIVVGARFTDNKRGSAYVFVGSGPSWTQQAKLVAFDGAANDEFGASVAISGNKAVVGADRDDTPAGGNAGSAYIFDRIGTSWGERQKLTANDAAGGDRFGFSVAIGADSTVVVGAINDDNARGSAYVFGGCSSMLSPLGQSFSSSSASQAAKGAVSDRSRTLVLVTGGIVRSNPSSAPTSLARASDLP